MWEGEVNHDAFAVEKTLESVYGTVKPSLGVLQEWKRVQERSATGRTELLDAEVTGRGKVRKGWRRGWMGWKETKCSHVTFHVGWRNVSFVENGGRGSREPTYPSHTHTHAVRLSFCARTPLLLSSAAGGTCLPRACHSVHAAAAMTHPTHLRKGPGVVEGEKEGKGVERLIFLSDADEINTVKSGKIV